MSHHTTFPSQELMLSVHSSRPQYLIYRLAIWGSTTGHNHPRVGKSSLRRYLQDKELANPSQSIDWCDFGMSERDDVPNTPLILQIWDLSLTLRSASWNASFPTFAKRCQHHFIMFDITSRLSFDLIVEHWMGKLEEVVELSGGVMVLIGNKIDLDPNHPSFSSSTTTTTTPATLTPSSIQTREVEYHEAFELAENYKCRYYEISLLTGEGIDAMIRTELNHGVTLFKPNNRLADAQEHLDVDVEEKDQNSSGSHYCEIM